MVAEADAEEGDFCGEDVTDDADHGVGGGGVAGPIGDEYAVGITCGDVGVWGVGRDDDGADAAVGEVAWGVGFDAHVVGDDCEFVFADGFDDVGFGGADLFGEVESGHSGL